MTPVDTLAPSCGELDEGGVVDKLQEFDELVTKGATVGIKEDKQRRKTQPRRPPMLMFMMLCLNSFFFFLKRQQGQLT